MFDPESPFGTPTAEHHTESTGEVGPEEIEEVVNRVAEFMDSQATELAEKISGIKAEDVQNFDETRRQILARLDAAIAQPSDTSHRGRYNQAVNVQRSQTPGFDEAARA